MRVILARWLARKLRRGSNEGRESFEAWDLTIEAPGGLNPPSEARDEAEEVVVVGQGECELAVGS